MAQPARHSERAEKLYPPAIQSSASLQAQKHLPLPPAIFRSCLRTPDLVPAYNFCNKSAPLHDFTDVADLFLLSHIPAGVCSDGLGINFH